MLITILQTTIFSIILFISEQTVLCSQLPVNCGTSDVNASNVFDWRIVGGSSVGVGEFPWQVLLTREFRDDGESMISLCGGTIINEFWILTAAHCATDNDASKYKIYLGKNNLTKSEKTGILAYADKIVQHKDYDSETTHNDIALIKLRGRIDFQVKQNFLRPICLATSTTNLTSKCYATGWGDQSPDGKESNILLKVYEPLFDMKTCKYGKRLYDVDLKTNICAGGSRNGGTGTCSGDSGGPLQCLASSGKWYQIGITSWGVRCARPGYPDIFTRVSAFIDWIKDTLSKD